MLRSTHSCVLADTIDSRLEYVPDAVIRVGTPAQLDSETPPGALSLGTDYTYTYNTATRAVTLTLSNALLNGADGQTVRISYATRVVAVGDGAIANTVTMTVNGNPVATATDTTYWGALRVIKHEGTDEDARLDGARFELRSVNDGAAIAVDPTTVVAVGAAGTGGEISFEGVISSEVGVQDYLVETEAPLGYQRATAAQSVTIEHGQPVDGGQNFVYFSNTQVPAYTLPITGGSGQAAFMIGGAGLLAAALGFALFRRRKADTEV